MILFHRHHSIDIKEVVTRTIHLIFADGAPTTNHTNP
jgi:hypothetical protein